MRIRVQDLRQVIREEMDADLEGPGPEGRESLPANSVDDQIDAILIGFESDAVVEEMTLRSAFIIQEQGEDEEDEEGEEEEQKADMTKGSEESDVEEPISPRKPRLEVSEYARKVARLVENAMNMLDVESVVINRAIARLKESYGDEVALEFEDVLAQKFGIELEPESDVPAPPPAAGAGTGALGGV